MGPLLFLFLINDFKPTNDITKFVDDSSIFEVVLQNTRSKLDQTLSKTSEWVDRNYMELNGEKTKELRLLHTMNVRFILLDIAQRILGVTLPNFQ